MNYNEIEKHFENPETLTKLLEAFQEEFTRVEYFQDLLRNGVVDNPEEIDKTMKELTGIYMSLNIVVSIAETEKKNREGRYFNSKRMELEKEQKKIVSATLEREASVEVANYRRIRNIFQAYRDSCDRAISVCQSSLKSWEREKTLKHD